MLLMYLLATVLMATLGPALAMGWPRRPRWRVVVVALIVPGILLGAVSLVELLLR